MASITCGNCKGTHSSSAAVKACYGIQAVPTAQQMSMLHPSEHKALAAVSAQFQEQRQAVVSTSAGATPKQVSFLTALCAERPTWAEQVGYNDLTIAGLSKRAASQAIGDALKVPKEGAAAKAAQPQGAVISACPDGYYAVESATGNNDLDFFSVESGKAGTRWEGRQFVRRIIGGHPNQSIRGLEAAKAIERILAAGPEQAAAKYGQEIGQCGRCNRHLTDEESRKIGIGPVCRSHSW